MTLFLLNPKTGKIWEYSEVVYDSMVDLIIIENSTPAVTLEEEENSEAAENEDVAAQAEIVLPETEVTEATEATEGTETTEAVEATENSEEVVESEETESESTEE